MAADLEVNGTWFSGARVRFRASIWQFARIPNKLSRGQRKVEFAGLLALFGHLRAGGQEESFLESIPRKW
jgi:hypothetical protein